MPLLLLIQLVVKTHRGRFKTFKHGAFYGVLTGAFLVFPILGTIALFERKSVKYVAINAGCWIVTLALKGGILCQWIAYQ